jgi:cytochrome c peroxidase
MFYRQPPAYNPDGERFVDHGLAAITKRVEDDGKFRVPTLRNIARTNAYGHNGYFDNLPFMLDFLNSRDVGSRDSPTCSRIGDALCAWPTPESPATMEPGIGHLGLGEQDLADLAAFLATLTDEPL